MQLQLKAMEHNTVVSAVLILILFKEKKRGHLLYCVFLSISLSWAATQQLTKYLKLMHCVLIFCSEI